MKKYQLFLYNIWKHDIHVFYYKKYEKLINLHTLYIMFLKLRVWIIFLGGSMQKSGLLITTLHVSA